MKKKFANIVAALAWPLARFLIVHLSDARFVALLNRLIRFLERRNPDDFNIVVLGDAKKIFLDPESSMLARRMIIESRPAQFKALVRGALW